MLDDHEIDWTREWKEKGREEGRKQGREEALQVVRLVVIDLLEERFRRLSEEERRQVEAIGSFDELVGLVHRALRTTSLAELGL